MRARYKHGASLERMTEQLEHTARTVREHLSSASVTMRETRKQ